MSGFSPRSFVGDLLLIVATIGAVFAPSDQVWNVAAAAVLGIGWHVSGLPKKPTEVTVYVEKTSEDET